MQIDFGALAEYGPLGVALLALGYAYWRKDQKLNELQEARVAEARESVKALESSTAALEAMTEALKTKGAL